jgi:hypothetical protein
VYLMSNGIILLVFEGEKTEPHIYNSIQDNFFGKDQSPIIYASFKAEIYQLWMQIKDDPFLDLLELLRERDNDNLKNIARNDISEIHLFFDHEGHSHPEMSTGDYNILLNDMLTIFSNETDIGKLYISYPMVEAIKDAKKEIGICSNCTLYIPENEHYKELVASRSDYNNLHSISLSDWHYLFLINIVKAFCITHGTYGIPEYKEYLEIDQISLLLNQYNKYILQSNAIVVLSAIPFFVISYFGQPLYDELLKTKFLKYCSFFCIQ